MTQLAAAREAGWRDAVEHLRGRASNGSVCSGIPAGQPGGRQVVAVDCAARWIDNDPEGKEYDCHHVPEEWPCREIKLLARVYLEAAE